MKSAFTECVGLICRAILGWYSVSFHPPFESEIGCVNVETDRKGLSCWDIVPGAPAGF